MSSARRILPTCQIVRQFANTRRVLLAGGPVFLAVGLGWVDWQRRYHLPVRVWRASVEQAQVFLRMGRPDLAFQAVSDARDHEPDAGEAVAVAGIAMARMGELRTARQARASDPIAAGSVRRATVTLAELHVDLGNGWRGAELFRQAVGVGGDSRVRPVLARVLYDLSEFSESTRAYERVLELDPERREAITGLIRGLLQTHESERAEKWVVQGFVHSDDPVILGRRRRRILTTRIDSTRRFPERHRPSGFVPILSTSCRRSRCRIAMMMWGASPARCGTRAVVASAR